MFVLNYGSSSVYLLLYVDDIILTANSTKILNHIITSLCSEFAMTDLGPLQHFLCILVQCRAGGLVLSQH
jgi:hypothetical protein